MGGRKHPKPRKSKIVKIKLSHIGAAKKRKAEDAEIEGSNDENLVISEASQNDHAQVIPGDLEGQDIDLIQRSGIQRDSENPDEEMQIMTVGTDRASMAGLRAGTPTGHTNEVGPENVAGSLSDIDEVGAEILRGISTINQAVEKMSARVDQMQHDAQQAQRDLDRLIRSSVKELHQRVTELEESTKQQTVKTSEMLQAISDALTAVKASDEGQSADRTVVSMGNPESTNVGMGAPRTHSSAEMTAEAPTEYCRVTFNGEIYRLLLTDEEARMMTESTCLTGFIVCILRKHYTILELQNLTLTGIGANEEPRPKLEPWLVELIIKAAETWRPFPPVHEDEIPDHPLNTSKDIHDDNLSATVCNLIAEILHNYRETRDAQGDMLPERPRVNLAEVGQGQDQEHPGEHDEHENYFK